MVTDAMIAAARDEFIAVAHGFYYPSNEQIRCVLEAAEKARLPIHELVMKVQNNPHMSQSASFHSPHPRRPHD